MNVFFFENQENAPKNVVRAYQEIQICIENWIEGLITLNYVNFAQTFRE